MVLYAHAQSQSRSAEGVRRGRRAWQFHRRGEGAEPDAARGDASGAGARAAVPCHLGGALRQAGEKLIVHARQLLEDDARAQMEMRKLNDGWLGRVRVGTSATVLMYALPPILRRLKTAHPQLEISLKTLLTATTLEMLKTNALDLGLCALPVEDPAFEVTSLFED